MCSWEIKGSLLLLSSNSWGWATSRQSVQEGRWSDPICQGEFHWVLSCLLLQGASTLIEYDSAVLTPSGHLSACISISRSVAFHKLLDVSFFQSARCISHCRLNSLKHSECGYDWLGSHVLVAHRSYTGGSKCLRYVGSWADRQQVLVFVAAMIVLLRTDFLDRGLS